MIVRQDSDSLIIRSSMPWADARRAHRYPCDCNRGKAESTSLLHYRGWTLVDGISWRYAVRGAARVRVCRVSVANDEAIRMYRAKVDEWEASNG